MALIETTLRPDAVHPSGPVPFDPALVRPVFIFGCQRSGTTMLGSQLGKGDNAFALPEMAFVYPFMRNIAPPDADRGAQHQRFATDFFYRAIGLDFPRAAFDAALDDPDPRRLPLSYAAHYLAWQGIAVDRTRPAWWFEHSPTNRDYFPALAEAFPNAKFIHIIRDPRPIYLSMRDNPWFPPSDPVSVSMTWIEAVPKGWLQARKHPDRVIEVRYEDLLTDTEATLRRLCDFIGIAFIPEMLRGGAVRLPEFTQAMHALTVTGAQKSKVSDWRGRITADDDHIIKALCNIWMHEYGYLEQPYYAELSFGTKLRHFLSGLGRRIRGKLVVWRANRRTRVKS